MFRKTILAMTTLVGLGSAASASPWFSASGGVRVGASFHERDHRGDRDDRWERRREVPRARGAWRFGIEAPPVYTYEQPAPYYTAPQPTSIEAPMTLNGSTSVIYAQDGRLSGFSMVRFTAVGTGYTYVSAITVYDATGGHGPTINRWLAPGESVDVPIGGDTYQLAILGQSQYGGALEADAF